MARDRKRAKQRTARRRGPVGQGAVATSADAAAAPVAQAEAAEDVVEREAAGDVSEREPVAQTRADGGDEGLAVAAMEPDEDDLDSVAAPSRAATGPRPDGSRVANFLRASWAELQRVQWPDRRQVGQATGVVLGFVAIAGAYLGLADVAAQKVVDAIL